MNARLAKEARALAPMFWLTLAALVALSLLLTGREGWQIVMTVFVGCCGLMAAVVFGNEFSARTMPLLLAQPVSRCRLWSEKMFVLGSALTLSFVVFVASEELLIHGEARADHFAEAMGAALLLVLCAYCATPGFTLAARNTLIGLAMTVVFPTACLMGLIFLAWLGGRLNGSHDLLFAETFKNHPDLPYCILTALTLIYCGITYWLGRYGFMQFQALDGAAGTEIGLPTAVQSGLMPTLKRYLPGFSNPLASLVRKEMLLQRVSFIVAAVSSLLVVCGWLAWNLYPSDINEGMTLTGIVLMVVLAPMLTGGVMMAEERNWGTLSWQLTLPASPRKQWFVKLSVACLTCLLVGVILPFVLTAVTASLQGHSLNVKGIDDIMEPMVGIMVYSILFGVMAFASSMCANVMKTIISGLGLVIAGGMLAMLVREAMSRLKDGWVASPNGLKNVRRIHDWLLNSSWTHTFNGSVVLQLVALVFVLLLALMFGLLLRFAYVNFRNGDVNPRRCRRQVAAILALTAVLAVPIFGAIYLIEALNDFGNPPPEAQHQTAPKPKEIKMAALK